MRFDPASPGYARDPFATHRLLRERDPIHRWHDGDWVLTRYADCERVLKDARFGLESPGPESEADDELPEPFRSLESHKRRWMLFRDPPDHTRLREPLQAAFAASSIERWRPRIEAVAGELLDAVRDRGEMDLVADFARPLPVLVIAELLGVPAEDRRELLGWSAGLVDTADLLPAPLPRRLGAALAARSATAYLRGLLERRATEPRDDLLRPMLDAHRGGRLDADELLANALLLLFAGFETTTAMLGNGVTALLEHPEQWARLRADPSSLPHAVDELLRFDAPLTLRARRVQRTTELAGCPLAGGDRVLTMLAAANRDPARFADPDRLDVTRRGPRSLAFGVGPHACPGAALARLEGEVALGALIERMPRLRRAEAAARRTVTIAIRGFESVPLRF